ncbi:MAG: vWA domain-containing protein [Hyphomicrobiaceae bacterium]
MNLALDTPVLLFLMPLALLPFFVGATRPQPYPSLSIVEPDQLSTVVAWTLKSAAALCIAGLLLGLAGLHMREQQVERTGKGAHIVLLLDRSSSMDNTFAGRQPTGGEVSKSVAAEQLLSKFVSDRQNDRFGVAGFSTSPFHVLPLTDRREAVQAAIAAIDRQGLAYTDVGRGLLLALRMHDQDPSASSRAILLISDGAAVIERRVQDKLRQGFSKRQPNLYWLYFRTEGSRGIHDPPGADEEDTPRALPERHLHKFFSSLGSPYRAFEAENPAAIADAIEAINKLESRPINYIETIPRKNLAPAMYAVALVFLGLLLVAKLAEAPLAMNDRES